MSERVTITVENHIADVRLNRPEKMNALDPDMFTGIIAAGKELAEMKDVRAIVLSGEGRAFCAGLDMASFSASGTETGGGKLTDRTYGNSNKFQEVAMQWRKLPMPVIAAVHGVAFGGGLQIMSGADVVVAHPETRMAVMEMRWGLVPDMGGYPLWRGAVNPGVLRELTYTNREFSGEDAHGYGFVAYLDNDPKAKAMGIAETIAGRNPDAIKAAKRLFNQSHDLAEDALLMQESVEQQAVIRTPNQTEAVMAQMAKRSANFAD